MMRPVLPLRLLAAGTLCWMLVGCFGLDVQPTPDPRSQNPTQVRKTGSTGKVFGDSAFSLGGSGKGKAAGNGGGIGVNSFLWRASLDTLVFMPISSADPFGGVILTDWHVPPDSPATERFKLTVYILGRTLRADGVRVAVFRQVRKGGAWEDASVAESVGTQIEDAILTKARQLRHESLGR